VLIVDYAILLIIKITSKSLNRMKGMYSVPNSLNCLSIYLDKILELPYSEQTIKTYMPLFEEFIQYCQKDVLTILNAFIHCGIVLQRTYSKMGLIYAISSFLGQESSKINEISTHVSEKSIKKIKSKFDEL